MSSVGDACAHILCQTCCIMGVGGAAETCPGFCGGALALTLFVLAILAATPVLDMGVGGSLCLFILSFVFCGLTCRVLFCRN